MHPIVAVMLVLLAIAPSQALPTEYEDVAGTRTSWDFDTNIDQFNDGLLVMENVTVLNGDIRCALSFSNFTSGASATIMNTLPSWNDIPLVVKTVVDDGRIHFDVISGSARRFSPVNVSINNVTWIAAYDLVDGVLLSIFQENGSNPAQVERQYFLRMSSTDIFFTPSSISPVMTWVAIAIFGGATVYTVMSNIKDGKLRKKAACFNDECWS